MVSADSILDKLSVNSAVMSRVQIMAILLEETEMAPSSDTSKPVGKKDKVLTSKLKPLPNLLHGTWVGSYGPFTITVAPPPGAIPTLGPNYTPSAGLICLFAKNDKTLSGRIFINLGGFRLDEKPFSGTYEIFKNQFGTGEGEIHLHFPLTDPGLPDGVNTIRFLVRSDDELAFILVRSEPANAPRNFGNAAVHGTLKRQLPLTIL